MKLLLLASAVLAAAAVPATAQPAPPTPKPVPGTPRPVTKPVAAKPGSGPKMPALETFTLENGLRGVFLRHDAAPVVAVEVWYHVGSKDEPRDRRGSAHMFEHIMFKGTKRTRSEAHARFVSGVGGTVNAHTSEDATAYVQIVPAAYLDFVLELEAERMRNLLFREASIATEREVVKEEIRQQENDPVSKGLLRFLEIAYQKHPYAWTAGGNAADLDRTTPADLKAFYDQYYQPGNALVVVVGQSSLAEVKGLVEKHFGAIPGGAAPPRPADATPEPPQTAKRREVVEPGQIGIVFAGWKIPEAKGADVYALQVLSLVMGAGESARLRQRIKAVDPKLKKPVGVEAASPILVREHPGLFLALGVYREADTGAAVEAAIFDEMAKVASKPPTGDELRKAKNQILAGFVFGLDSPLGLAEQIGQSWILTGDPTQWLRDLEAFEKITSADVARVAKTYLTPERATVVVVPPKGAQ
jgi:zinc protease